jgi:hypothetical protein
VARAAGAGVSGPVLDAEQVALLRHVERGWTGALLIAYPDAGIRGAKERQSGGAGSEWYFDCNAQGIHGTRRHRLAERKPGEYGPVHEVSMTWAQVRAAVTALPLTTVMAVKAAYDEWHLWRMRDVQPYGRPGAGGRDVAWVEVDPDLIRGLEARMGAAVHAAFELLVPAEELALW